MPRPTDWIDTTPSFITPTGGQSFQSLMIGVAPVNMRGMTLIRTILSMTFSSTTVAGAWGRQSVHLAIGVASQEAFAAGALPDPAVPTDKPPRGWVYKTHVGVGQNGAGAAINVDIHADIRGARKIENGELYIIVDNIFIVGTTFSVQMTGLVRTLYKL